MRSSHTLFPRETAMVMISAMAITGCRSATTSARATSVASNATTLAASRDTFPGIPALPDIVTVVPFELDDTSNMQILFPATVSGRQGIFQLDTGDPFELLLRHYVKPNAAGGLDTVRAGESIPTDLLENFPITVRIGTLESAPPVVADIVEDSGYARTHRFQTSLGRIGLNALESFETIIDYTHKRLVLIRLDAAGHRLVEVPAYTPASAIPMFHPQQAGFGLHWAVEGKIGDVVDTLQLDTGTPIPVALYVNDSRYQQALSHVANEKLDHLVIAGHSFDGLSVIGTNAPMQNGLLGSPFLSLLGVVGFNQRTHQLMLYK